MIIYEAIFKYMLLQNISPSYWVYLGYYNQAQMKSFLTMLCPPPPHPSRHCCCNQLSLPENTLLPIQTFMNPSNQSQSITTHIWPSLALSVTIIP